MRSVAVLTAALAIAGCGQLVDSDYPGPPLARLRYTTVAGGAGKIGLLWNLEDAKRGSYYDLPATQQWFALPGEDVPLDVYGQMPGFADMGVAFIALFGVQDSLSPIVIDGVHFVDVANLVAVDTTHVLLFTRARSPSSTDSVVWPQGFVVDNPEQLVGSGYHLAEVRCNADGTAAAPLHVALVDEPLDRDEARPLFRLAADQQLAESSAALGAIPRGRVADSCLVLP